MTVAELTASRHNPGPTALTHGRGEMLLLEYFLEVLDAVCGRTLKGRSRILIERNKIDLGSKTSQELRQLYGICR